MVREREGWSAEVREVDRQDGREVFPRKVRAADEAGRGCQVSLAVTNGRQVFDFLTTEGVFADWREPDVIRVAPVGLYNTFEEVWQFAGHLQAALHKFAL